MIITVTTGLSVDKDGLLVTVEERRGSQLCITKVDPVTGHIRRVPFTITSARPGGNRYISI